MRDKLLDSYEDGWKLFEEIRLEMLANTQVKRDRANMRSPEGIRRQLEQALKKSDKTVSIHYLVERRQANSHGGPLVTNICIETKVFTKK